MHSCVRYNNLQNKSLTKAVWYKMIMIAMQSIVKITFLLNLAVYTTVELNN